uniref:Dynein heavy chain region D6 P-loop domain-containing protein n=1 Tax=Amphimedon queenslandica TaxID=400682 RepID=A0A1X7SV58_AMPQE
MVPCVRSPEAVRMAGPGVLIEHVLKLESTSPSPWILEYKKLTNFLYSNIYGHTISMGQGQEVHARRLLQQCQTQGGWVLLQNGHLALDFMDELLNTIVETQSVHETFRLWMTTEIHPKFPINLLQISIKYTFEPPQGVKAGLKRTYSSMTQ